MSGNQIDAPASGDADLITAAHEGDDAAYGELYKRHVAGARAAARSLAKSRADADDLVSEAFTRVLRALRNGGGPELAFRPYLLTAVRNAFYDRSRKDARVDVRDEVPEDLDAVLVARAAMAGEDRELIARAFANLPERWQTVLWHTEVEGRPPAEVAPMLGIAPNAVAALAYRAREGLREAYLQAHLQVEPPPSCADARGKLGGYVRDSLSARDRGKVEQHLDTCDKCRAVLVELREVSGTLRSALPLVLLGVPATTYLHQLAAGGKGILALFGARPRGQQAAIGGGVAAAGVLVAVAVAAALGGDPSPAPQVAAVTIVATTTTEAPATTTASTVRVTTTPASTTTSSSSTTTTTEAPTTSPLVVPSATRAPATRATPATTRAATTTAAPAPPTTAPRRAALSVSGSPIGPVVQGRHAFVAVSVANAGPDDAANARAIVTLPPGFTYAGVQGEGWSSAAGAGTVSCARATLADGTSSTLLIEAAVAPPAAGTPAIGVTVSSDALGVPGGGSSSVPMGTVLASGPAPLYAGVRHGDIVTIGNTLMTCDAAEAGCAAAQADDPHAKGAGKLDNSQFTMVPVDRDADAQTTASSRAVLSLPPGATVNRAWLVWGGTSSTPSMTGAYDRVRLVGPGGASADYSAAGLTATSTEAYGRVEVTGQIVGQGAGTYTFGSLGGFAETPNDVNRSGGWSLVVQYDNAAAPLRTLVVLDGLVAIRQGANDTVALGLAGPGVADAGVRARIGLVAWDGDRGLTGDGATLVSGSAATPYELADIANPSNDLFNSTVSIAGTVASGGDPAYTNTLGFDDDVFDATVYGGGTISLSVHSDGDVVQLGLITLSVPA